MNKEEKIRLLKSLNDGNISLDEFRDEITNLSISSESGFENATPLEMIILVENNRKYGTDVKHWPEDQAKLADSIFEDLPNRIKQRRVLHFWFQRCLGDLYEIEYRDGLPVSKKFQLMVGYDDCHDNIRYPPDEIRIRNLSLTDRFPEILHKEITEADAIKICNELLTTNIIL